MTGDTNGAPASYGALLRAIDGLRDDVREDIAAMEARVTGVVGRLDDRLTEVRGDMTEYVVAHDRVHRERLRETNDEHEEFREFMEAARIEKARRDGALGVVRYVIETTARHAPRLIAILVPIILGILAATGQLAISVSVT